MSDKNRLKVKEYVKNSSIKAGHIYKDNDTGILYRVLGVGLEPVSFIPRVIYSEVNDLTGENLLIENLILLESRLVKAN